MNQGVFRVPALALLASCVLLTACAPRTRVVLLPDSGGRATAVVVRNNDSEQVLSHAYASTDVSPLGKQTASTLDAAAVKDAYADILRLTPAKPDTYTLEFETGGATLTLKSLAELDTVLTAATSRPGGEIVVIGYTDTTGTPEQNDRISQARANALRDLLVGRGFPADRIRAVGRGQRDLLVATGPGVDEPRNRRVLIVVR
ncbi:hypothetical protein CCO03_10225 [Comamonas serinivorans]|uniref:OmpA-like domain-containing protein n=1 Tax=Comamonas serinivorans TaxID=1082851 RepID=A0A1Y0ENL6_9BURK|nr:OmpA family protein [Comamonas serinivorans]ARU05011.1 hypothetical protein CCO03_10225 [Comamonas serinivorans]